MKNKKDQESVYLLIFGGVYPLGGILGGTVMLSETSGLLKQVKKVQKFYVH